MIIENEEVQDTDNEKTARALLVLVPDMREMQAMVERVATQVNALAKRYDVAE